MTKQRCKNCQRPTLLVLLDGSNRTLLLDARESVRGDVVVRSARALIFGPAAAATMRSSGEPTYRQHASVCMPQPVKRNTAKKENAQS